MQPSNDLYPLYFKPVYKSYIWGGRRIISDFHRTDAPEKVAESWEVSDRSDGMSVVDNGVWQGLTLHEVVEKLGENLLGKNRRFSTFPLLIKLIDAHENLSIQVHPDDAKAKLLGAEPKTEMWYFLKTQENAAVYAGLKPYIDKAAFEKAIHEDKVLETLEKIPVTKGDVISIPGGRVHAILSGCLLLEVQQNSNTTYRIYDWGRVDNGGKARPLHIRESLQVIDWDNKFSAKPSPKLLHHDEKLRVFSLLKTPYFEMQKIEAKEIWKAEAQGGSFQVFFALEGDAFLIADGWKENMVLGRTYLVPAGCREVNVEPQTRGTKFLRITL